MNVIKVKRSYPDIRECNVIKIDREAMEIVAVFAAQSNRSLKEIASNLIKYAGANTVVTDEEKDKARGMNFVPGVNNYE